MNAYQWGRESGFAYKLTIIGGSKRHFEAVGRNAAQEAYKTKAKQDGFLDGRMTNWTEPTTDSTPTAPDDKILTF